MRLFDIFKKKKEAPKLPKLTREQQLSKSNAIQQHRNRINNLNEEFEQRSAELESLESNYDIPKSQKQKTSDILIRRMTLLRYEIEIREGLLKWLS